MKKKALFRSVAVLGLGAIPVTVIACRSASQPRNVPPGERAVAVVQVVRPEAGRPDRDLRIPGSFEGYFTADLFAKVSGYVSEVNVDIGDTVRQGDPLLHIGVPELAEELRQAEARLAAREAQVEAADAGLAQARLMIRSAESVARRANAELDLNRITSRRQEQLFEAQAISDQVRDEARNRLAVADAQVSIADAATESARGGELVAAAELVVARADVAVAEAEVARLKALMDYTIVTAPFDGVITRRRTDPGAFVRSAADGAETPLLRLARTDRLRLVLDIAEPECPRVNAGTPVEVRVPALDGDPLRATIARTAGGLDPATRTMRAEVDLDNSDGRLMPGMYAHAVIRIVAAEQALMIPSAAVRSRGAETYVLVADGDVAKDVVVSLGRDDGIRASITAGLDGGEAVIASATGAVTAGVPVEPVPVQDVRSRPRR